MAITTTSYQAPAKSRVGLTPSVYDKIIQIGTADKATQYRVYNEIKRAIEDGYTEKKDIIKEIVQPKHIGKEVGTATEGKKTTKAITMEGEGDLQNALDFFKSIEKENSLEKEIPAEQRYKAETTSYGEDIAEKVFPPFQGNKKEMSRFATKLIMDKMPKEVRDGITMIDDNFGGSGSWGLYLGRVDLFPNLKKIRINEFDKERLKRIKILHNKEGVIKNYLDKNIDRLQYEFDNMLRSNHKLFGNRSLTGDVPKNKSGGSFKNRLLELAHAEKDEEAKASLKFMSDIIGRGVKSEELKRQLYRISEMADAIAKQVNKIKQKGVELEYVNKSAFELEREKGGHVLTLYDPPYYGTAGYDISFDKRGQVKTKSNKVEQWMYDLVEQDIKRLKELNHNILYTDENWWTKTNKNGKPDIPKDMAKLVNGTNAVQKRDSISENFTFYNDSMPIAQRREILALRITDGNNARNERLLQQPDRRAGKNGYDAKIRSENGNNEQPNDRRRVGNNKQHSNTTMDEGIQRAGGRNSRLRDKSSDKVIDYINSLLYKASKEDKEFEYPLIDGNSPTKLDKHGNLRDAYSGKILFSALSSLGLISQKDIDKKRKKARK